MTAINYEQKKEDLETWFRWHKEDHTFWKSNREEYLNVCEILKAKVNDNTGTSQESN